MAENTLYYGDNLDILRRYIKDESVDLVYLDPPFKSNQDYNVLFQEQDGSRSKAQIKAFEDTWRWDQGAAEAFREIVEKGPERVSQAMRGFRMFLGGSDMLAYLAMMAPRLVELRRVLKPTGSIYLHCDPTASHYLKMLMDSVFAPENFQREIIWRIGWVSGYKTRAKNWIRNHDVLLFYVRGRGFTFNKSYVLHEEGYLRRDGAPARSPGIPIEDVWGLAHEEGLTSIQIMSFSKEKLGYATQKPQALLHRIINASSNQGEIVLDPFCGCGTTIAAAQNLNRRWIGIDITHLAINLIKHRLLAGFDIQEGRDYEVIGEPRDLAGAQALAEQDPFQFQYWALGLVGARPVEQKKGADRGIDGRLFFYDEADKTKEVILQVKSGHATAAHVRDLRGVVEREEAAIGALITLQEATQPMRQEAASAGFYFSPGWQKNYPRIQILTVPDLLGGNSLQYPPGSGEGMTFQRGPKAKPAGGEQPLPGSM